MSEEWSGRCPHCHHRMHVHGRHTEGAHITCPGCHTSFALPVGGWAKRFAALAIVAGCLLPGIVALTWVLWTGSGQKATPSTQRAAQSEAPSPAVPEAPQLPEEPIPPPPPRAKTSDPPPVDDAPPPLPAPAPVADAARAKGESIKWLPPEEQAKVDRAMARGVAWLKENQQDDGSWAKGAQDSIGVNPPGMTALAGLALLHCGVPARDPAVQNVAAYLRQRAQNAELPFSSIQGDKRYGVYVSGLAILFFDRLGERRDEGLIRTLSLALIRGQSELGKWTYYCPILSAEAERSLLDTLRKSRPESPRQLFNAEPQLTTEDRNTLGDNSNTQFAVMALWAAARHQIPTERALARAARHFRRTQNDDGGWAYGVGLSGRALRNSVPSMTAAALFGLAVGHGLTLADTKQSIGDPALDNGMTFLGAVDNWMAIARRSIMMDDGSAVFVEGNLTLNFPFYALWSVERTAVIYNARTIGGRDWYAPGVRILLASQKANGRWKTHGFSLPDLVPTSFALLFLGRFDAAPELTRQLHYVEKEGQAMLIKTPDKSLPGLFYKRSPVPLEFDVTAPSSKEKSKP